MKAFSLKKPLGVAILKTLFSSLLFLALLFSSFLTVVVWSFHYRASILHVHFNYLAYGIPLLALSSSWIILGIFLKHGYLKYICGVALFLISILALLVFLSFSPILSPLMIRFHFDSYCSLVRIQYPNIKDYNTICSFTDPMVLTPK